jgi:hypothetical protein
MHTNILCMYTSPEIFCCRQVNHGAPLRHKILLRVHHLMACVRTSATNAQESLHTYIPKHTDTYKHTHSNIWWWKSGHEDGHLCALFPRKLYVPSQHDKSCCIFSCILSCTSDRARWTPHACSKVGVFATKSILHACFWRVPQTCRCHYQPDRHSFSPVQWCE